MYQVGEHQHCNVPIYVEISAHKSSGKGDMGVGHGSGTVMA